MKQIIVCKLTDFGEIFGRIVMLVALVGMVGTAQAQDAATEGNTLEEIIVTAQKRDQLAQDIPISLSVMRGEALENQGITSIEDLGNTLAGVNVASINPGQMRLTIRGVSDFSGSLQASSVNGYYLDETSISYVPGFLPELGLWDIERIELLRGPQGTLFGEGSVGGLLRVITRKPDSSEFFSRYQLGFNSTSGGGSGYSVLGSINAPLVEDVLAISLAASYRELPGWIDIPDLNETNTNETELTDTRVALRYTPSEALSVDAFYLHNDSDGFDNGATEPGTLDPASLVPGSSAVNALSPVDAELDVAALTISYDFGAATLVSASAYTEQKHFTNRDYSAGLPLFFGDPTATGAQDFDTQSEAFTQELRLVSNGDEKLDWKIGAYYKDEERNVREGNFFSIPAFGGLQDLLSTHSIQSGDAWAIFGNIDYELTDKLTGQVGVRYFSDKKDFIRTDLTSSVLFGTTAGNAVNGDDGATATSPKFALNYALNDDVMLYAKAEKGFRSGGANVVPLDLYPEANGDFDEDSLWSYEIGLKSSPGTGWFVNVYAFVNDWTDLQVPFRTSDNIFGFTNNAGSATSSGAEIEVGGQVSDALTLGVTYSYTDSTIDDDVFDAAGNLAAADGNHIPQSPKHKFTVSAEYAVALMDSLKLKLNGRFRTASSFFSDSANLVENDRSKLLFLSIGVSGNWGTLRVYGDNLLDREDTLAKYKPIGALPFEYISYVRPRNVGIEFIGEF